MSKNKLTIDFKGYKSYYEKLDRLGGDIKKATEEALEKSFHIATPGIEAAIKPHKRSGRTEDSLVKEPNIKWEGNVGSVDIGFSIRNGGLASVFLMYGTPRHAVANKYGKSLGTHPGIPIDQVLYDSIFGKTMKSKARKAQKEIFDKALQEALK